MSARGATDTIPASSDHIRGGRSIIAVPGLEDHGGGQDPGRSMTALAWASLMFAASMAPSLLPRGWLAQGVISGLAAAVGYALGLVARRFGLALGRRARRVGRLAVAARVYVSVALGVALWSVVVHQTWQTDVRQLMGLLPAPWHYPLAVTATALATAGVVVLLGRLVRTGHRAYVRGISRVAPPRWERAVRVLVALVLAVLMADVVMADWTVQAVRDASAAADARYEPEVGRPKSSARSGGPGSAVGWDELGRMGRAFTGTGPTREDLAAFSGAASRQPIRVYVGLAEGESASERAELAVAELERTGAFQRQVLLLASPTGSGWVDSDAIDPLEYLYNGDTAAAAIQYSYLPSWATMMGNQDRAEDAARALFDAVSEHLSQMPPQARPRLLLYGQSLGAFGSQQLFESVDDLAERGVDGAVWAGPPRASALWRNMVASRDAGSPVWQPVYQRGTTVRFGSNGAALAAPGPVWHSPRIAYLQNATDPISWWSPRLLTSRPEWMNEPRGPGVSAHMPFVPIVTGLQVALDLLQSMDAPGGHGHVFDLAHAEAWAMVAPPEGWSNEDTARLLSVLASGQPG